MGEDQTCWNDQVSTEIELLQSVYADDFTAPQQPLDHGGNASPPTTVKLAILCRPRTGGQLALAFIKASLVIELDAVRNIPAQQRA